MRFGKERRVRKRPEYKLIQRMGRRVSTSHFVLVIWKRKPELLAELAPTDSRLGITASRKVGNSVRRSRLKRIIREAFRLYPEVVPLDCDLVVICKTDNPELCPAAIATEWQKARPRIERALSSPSRQRSKRAPS